MITELQIPANWSVCAHGIGQFTLSEPVREGDNYAVVEISNHLVTFFVDSKLTRHFVGYSVLEASCTMGTGSFTGLKWPGCGADHPPPSSAEVKKK
jgi:hypothetical protein